MKNMSVKLQVVDFIRVNFSKVGKFYHDMHPMCTQIPLFAKVTDFMLCHKGRI